MEEKKKKKKIYIAVPKLAERHFVVVVE